MKDKKLLGIGQSLGGHWPLKKCMAKTKGWRKSNHHHKIGEKYKVKGVFCMDEEKKCQNKNVDKASTLGPLWFIGWLFTVGFVHLSFWKAVLALVLWPYYLGVTLSL